MRAPRHLNIVLQSKLFFLQEGFAMPKNKISIGTGFAQKDNSLVELADNLQGADRKGALIVALPKWTAVAIIVWQAGLSIDALTGENAIPSLLLRFGRETSYWELVCWTAGLMGILFGAYSHHLLRRQKSQVILSQRLLENRLAAISGASSMNDKASGNSGRNM
jgi:hypothetical protein